MLRHLLITSSLCFSFCVRPYDLRGEQRDPLDPFSFGENTDQRESDDSQKNAEELVQEANELLEKERLIDARSKLLSALEKDPSYYQAHMMLAGYYMVHVGHFRLAFKYVDRAMKLFEEQHGKPPYANRISRAEHANLLYLLSQIRLNLDNYQGALDTLDEYQSHGYYSVWYAGTRAWILMKLGRLEEAIKEARLGLLMGAESGRTLNMLGILLSMHGEPDSALRVFREAIQYELSLGSSGQPATPLNNSGEVYKEIYDEDKAESAWVQSKSLPDGCEHVLPSLNLALLYIDQTKYREASDSIDSYLTCFAQFPLRNGEEHQALVHLARGRVAAHAGSPELGASHLEEALEDIQWFGKIGTSQGDLKAGALTSLALALEFHLNQQSLTPRISYKDYLSYLKAAVIEKLRIWWLRRRALQTLIEDLDNIEDLRIRNTDSLLEYPTLGTLLRNVPPSALERRLLKEREDDPRSPSLPYYETYLAESFLAHGMEEEAVARFESVLTQLRERYDDALKLHILAQLAHMKDLEDPHYNDLLQKMFELAPASVWNYGLKLPVVTASPDLSKVLENIRSPFLVQPEAGAVRLELEHKKSFAVLRFQGPQKPSIEVTGPTVEAALIALIQKVFREPIGSWLTKEIERAEKLSSRHDSQPSHQIP
jgi:Tfp pilus assembly protein PilF